MADISNTFFVARDGHTVIVSEHALHLTEYGWETEGDTEIICESHAPHFFPLFNCIPDDGVCHYVKITVEELE